MLARGNGAAAVAVAIAVAALTLLTQLGGVIFLVAFVIGKRASAQGGLEALAVTVLFVGLYAGSSLSVVPALAKFSGRVPLPCSGVPAHAYRAASPLYRVFNRHYVDPRLLELVEALSSEIARAYPGAVTLYLDANFPLLDGFPLPPHLSHHDGRKLDLAFYYASEQGTYLPGLMRSPIGYWAFEEPRPGDPAPCAESTGWPTLRWDMVFLERFYPQRSLEPERTRTALQWLVRSGPSFGVEKIFIEPHLAARLGVSSRLLRFQGCRAARHDDHIHIQVTP